MKTCRSCHQEKPLEDFYLHPTTRDGRAVACRDCTRADYRRRYRGETGERGRNAERRLARRDHRETEVRAVIYQPNLLDTVDRSNRRADLAAIGGLCGVREIRARIRRLRAAKAMRRGEEIPADMLDALLPA